jgi:hypothetical protein
MAPANWREKCMKTEQMTEHMTADGRKFCLQVRAQ